ncbi:hypothetical protein Tdes44962_MAKER09923 [Teratosphaeria destructans]|uniref:Uncharacterized protein n=1 Tax=Teratosphaeria destructans TaxID=418781 RepID=A0A9W7W1P4_9PEZI|nr:hypothetical protein Tdes44962_MAKER09923 [Teratosphaeria destructans]
MRCLPALVQATSEPRTASRVQVVRPAEMVRCVAVRRMDSRGSFVGARGRGREMGAGGLRGIWAHASSYPASAQTVLFLSPKRISSRVSSSPFSATCGRSRSKVLPGWMCWGRSSAPPSLLLPLDRTSFQVQARWSSVAKSCRLMKVAVVLVWETSCTGSRAFLYSIRPLLGVWSDCKTPSMTKLPSLGMSPKSPP